LTAFLCPEGVKITSCHAGRIPIGANSVAKSTKDIFVMPPRPDSRVYKHHTCGGQTVVSGDDYLLCEFPHRSISGTFCCKCNTFAPLWEFEWMDTGENVYSYRHRLHAADSLGRAFHMGLFGNAVVYRPPPLDGVFGDKTHFHWYDPPQPASEPPPVRQAHGSADRIPPEVTALGQASHMHYPQTLRRQLHKDLRPFAVLGLLVVMAGAALLVWATLPLQKTLGVLLILIGLGGVLLLFFKKWPAIPSYAAFDDALVIINGTEFTLIPWAAMTQFNPGTGALTADGKEFNISGGIQDRRLLVRKIKDRLINQLLPGMSESLREGEAFPFGPLTLRRIGIEKKGEQLNWDEVRKIDIAVAPSGRSDMWVHRKGGVFAWAKLRFDEVPNSFVILELIRRNMPPGAPLTGA
jgi:hypothetical protein